MRTRGRLAAVLAAGAAATLSLMVGAGAAYADVEGRIDSSVADDEAGTLTLAFSALGLQPGDTIDPKSVVTTINGTEVPSSATLISAGTDQKRTSVLTIDVSTSMRDNGKMDAAKQAANVYLDSLPEDVSVGLVTFGNLVTAVVQPTTDRATVKAAVDGLAAGGGTPLYDGIVAGVVMLGTEGIRSQLLISDGIDRDSTASLAETVTKVKDSKSTLDAVVLGTPTAQQLADMTTLVAAGNGKVINADGPNLSQTLTDAFASSAQASAQQLQITTYVPQQFVNTGQTVSVSANTTIGLARADTYAFMPTKAAAPIDISEAYGPVPVPSTNPGLLGQQWFLWLAVAAVGVGLFVLLAIALLATDRESRESGRLRRRLNRYSLTPRSEQAEAAPTALGESQVARSAVEFAGRAVQGSDLDTRLSTKLDAAGVPLRAPEWLLVHFGIAFGTALVFTLVAFGLGSDGPWLATIIGLILGAVGPWAYLAIKEDRRKAAFATALPETLQLLSGSLAAGYSLPQAVDAVVRESDGPMAVELNRAIVEARLGVPMEDALESVATRMDSVDFAWVVMAIRIQREVGGNLSEVLSNVAATMRERERLRRQVEVLSAEGRLSAVILGLLPILFIVYLVIARPEYLAVLVTTPLGLVMIVVGIILLIAGVFWLRATVKVEV